MNLRLALSAALVLTVLALGCSRKKPAADADDEPAPASDFHQGPALTLEDGKRFADRLEAAAVSGKLEQVSDCFDLEALLNRGLTGTGIAQRDRAEIMKGEKQTFARQSLAREIVDAATKGGSYLLLRVRQKDGETRALFRFVPTSGGVNYHDLVLARRPDGQLRAIDLHVMVSGELMSETMRRVFLTMNAEVKSGMVGKLLGRNQDLIKHRPTWSKMAPALRAGDNEEVLRLYSQLPPSLHKEKSFQIMRLRASASLGGERHQQALEEYQKTFPGDPSADLMNIDLFLLQKKYDEALACVDRLDLAVEGDPFLDTMRANVHLEAGAFEKARQAYEKALAALPALNDPYLGLINVASRQKDYATMLKWVNEIQSRLGVDLMVEQDAFYADFVKSPEYTKWKAEQKKGD